MEKEIIEGNKLIHKFYLERGQHPARVIMPEEMEYHSSWDWLMPVVSKITKTHPMNQSWFDVKYRLIEGDVLGTRKAVVEFIKWWNENNKP